VINKLNNFQSILLQKFQAQFPDILHTSICLEDGLGDVSDGCLWDVKGRLYHDGRDTELYLNLKPRHKQDISWRY